MHSRILQILFICLFATLFSGCNLLKFVPDDKYLLYHTGVQVDKDGLEDPKDGKVAVGKAQTLASDLSDYIRQTPNTKVLGFWPLQLQIYNTAPLDTTSEDNRWLRRNAFRMGQAPEIYDESMTDASVTNIRRAMQNKGFFEATVDTSITIRKRRVKLIYHVHPGRPYIVRSYNVDISNPQAMGIARDRRCLIARGTQFDIKTLDSERQRIASAMRNSGYYYYEKDILDFEADSSWHTHEVALTIRESQVVRTLSDSLREQIYTPMYISRLFFHQDGKRPMRENALRSLCYIRPGDRYSERRVEMTYARLNALEAIKYVDISFVPVAKDSLECHITLSRSKQNAVSAGIEGTYSAGDWGIAVDAKYSNKNIFRGAEVFTVDTRVGHEWREDGGRAIEVKGGVGIKWPNTLALNLGANFQRRPNEYERTIATATFGYTYRRPRSRWRHMFNLVDINYVRVPQEKISQEYYDRIIAKSSILRHNFEDHFIVDFSYTGIYSNKSDLYKYRSYVDFRYLIETAGNVLYGIGMTGLLPKDQNDHFTLFKIAFAQYAKGNLDFTYNQYLADRHRLVWHAGLGVIVPYLNSASVPFEKRFFAGGSNSVRGWQARTLGPGGYKGADGSTRYDLQVGDIRLDLNLEYRWRVWNFIELATFTDAGNVWLYRNYKEEGDIDSDRLQENGRFRWDKFYREIAWSYGAGLRLDLSVVILRVDMGVKLYDPTRLYTDGLVWRTAPNGLSWRQGDFTFHFAIGYPF